MKWIAIILSIAGCLLVLFGLLSEVEIVGPESTAENTLTNNSFTMGNCYSPLFQRQQDKHKLTSTFSELILGFFLSSVSGVLEASTVLSSKAMGTHIEHPMILAFYFALSGIPLSFTLMLILELDRLSFPTDGTMLFYLAGHTFMTGMADVTYFLGLDYGSAVAFSIAYNAEIPMRMFFQYIAATDLQPIDGSLWDITGAVIVTCGIALPPIWEFLISRKCDDTGENKRLFS